MSLRILLTIVACSLFVSHALGQQPWPVDGPYEPKHVYAAVAGAIHEKLEIPIQGNPPYWFNVSTVGYPYDHKTKEGKIGLNALANFMPPADGRLSTGKKGGLLIDLDRRLDRWYKFLLDNIAFTYETKTSEVKEAEKVMYILDPTTGEVKRDESGAPLLTPAYQNYKSKRNTYRYWDKMKSTTEVEISPQERAKAEIQWLTASDDLDEAKRNGVGTAVGTLTTFWNRDGASQNLDRLEDLKSYRVLYKLEEGNNSPPLSHLIPPAETWADGSGWYEASFSQTDSYGRFDKHVKRFSGGGGFNLGFITIGGSGGKDEVTQSRLNSVQKFAYKLKLKRILIYRPWFDASLLETYGWTWNEKKDGAAFPVIAKSPNADGSPVASEDVFKTKGVGLALIPVQLILAKDLEISCTVSKAEWQMAKTQTQVGGGGMFFGIIALKADSSNVDEMETNMGRDVLLTAKQPDVSIIGAISRVVPVAPVPNRNAGNWPASAWKPWE
ncbi:MAG: hypothetical protein JNM18_23470 [Planctomycetaceae bacterium]|nr:hypothetical protein [Planctomycetaceae bacterium]